ncbi:Hydroquinone glucosyltransferase [Actinidia chinensis var. chinensis]|uniref:Hydroquinone glucosyltransferase n=1 Tax=Actinidia chinensis var. chinensis TaxID=1590841 RepID=A0A2R6QZM9_ACTCC|nr:Hydroquinone glucosyltransferase [Actinidia chinensis var. chinensis]
MQLYESYPTMQFTYGLHPHRGPVTLSLREVFKSLVASSGLVALVVDLFGTDAFGVANEFKVSPYIFFPSTAMALSLFLYLPKLDEAVSCEYRDLPEPVRIPGCIPVHGRDLLDPLQERKTDAYKWVLHHAKRYRLAEWILLNSFKELERFIWVVRSPNDKVANASHFSVNSQNDPYAFLLKGIPDRTKGFGLVVPSWTPQTQILSHRGGTSHTSMGGFLTHCGWNSTLASVVYGIPLVAWSLYAEQKMNVIMLAEDLKVALRPKVDENGLVGRVEIAKVVKVLMEGEEGKGIPTQMRDLKEAATKVLSEDGDSTKALTELAQKWKNKITN